jgi:hypothetical protein
LPHAPSGRAAEELLLQRTGLLPEQLAGTERLYAPAPKHEVLRGPAEEREGLELSVVLSHDHGIAGGRSDGLGRRDGAARALPPAIGLQREGAGTWQELFETASKLGREPLPENEDPVHGNIREQVHAGQHVA